MQARKKTVALIEPTARNVDVAFQRATLANYAKKYNFEIDLFIGDHAPVAGTAGPVDHRNLINDIKDGGVGQLLILADARHAVPEKVLEAAKESGAIVKFVDVQQERGLAQPT
jgi:hypothetical protein